MSKPGRQRRTPAQRIKAKVARATLVTTRRQKQFDALMATSDETLAEFTSITDKKK